MGGYSIPQVSGLMYLMFIGIIKCRLLVTLVTVELLLCAQLITLVAQERTALTNSSFQLLALQVGWQIYSNVLMLHSNPINISKSNTHFMTCLCINVQKHTP